MSVKAAGGEKDVLRSSPNDTSDFTGITPPQINIHIGLWKCRTGPAGLHLFNRATGVNLLLDEIAISPLQYSRAPRQVSVALTNRCDLACKHCYAPKSPADLPFANVTHWLAELDAHGALGVGFGGGEPTLYPKFVDICEYATHHTQLAVSFTTHGHHIDDVLANRLRGNTHFIRVSMDGVGATYEMIRRRSFPQLLTRLHTIRSISRFGVNVVINEHTLRDLDQVAKISADAGACEILLLPQISVGGVPPASVETIKGLQRWVGGYDGPLNLSISEASAEGFPFCDPLVLERGLRAYAHIDASGVLKPSSYSSSGVKIDQAGILSALDNLTYDTTGGNQ
jgi:hypothetical protein